VLWRKLTKILPLVVALAAGGGALSATSGQVSPNLTIVTKAEKSDKIQKTGFTALLKRSAENWGKGLKRLIVQAGQPKRSRYAAGPKKPCQAMGVTFKMPSQTCRHFEPESTKYKAAYLPVKPLASIAYKEGFMDDMQASMEFSPAHRRRAPDSGQRYVLSLPRFPRFLDWLRPTAWLSSGISDSRVGSGSPRVAMALPGEIRPVKPGTSLGGGTAPTASGDILSEYHFTIDPVDACASLAHGILGSGSALSGHRSRNNRA